MDQLQDRKHAGRKLAKALAAWAGDPSVIVLGLPRGGVPVAHEVAKALGAPMDVCLVRKLGVPGHEELAMGALASGGVRVMNESVLRGLGITPAAVASVAAREERELKRRENAYRGGRPPPAVAGRIVILVDDGLATGATMRAAILALRAQHPLRIIVAVPVAPADTCEALRAEADDVVCLNTPWAFPGVGAFYEDFSQTTDAEVRQLLRQHEGPGGAPACPPM